MQAPIATPAAPLVIFLLGLPASGKSSLARRLARDLALPVVSKDEIKEQLFDSLGQSDREWAKRLGGAAFDILYLTLSKLLLSRSCVIVDADFVAPQRAQTELSRIAVQVPYRSLRINLVCDGDVLFERFKSRSLSGERHPGHVDHLNFAEFEATLRRGRRPALELDGELMEVDTSDLERIPYRSIVDAITAAMRLS